MPLLLEALHRLVERVAHRYEVEAKILQLLVGHLVRLLPWVHLVRAPGTTMASFSNGASYCGELSFPTLPRCICSYYLLTYTRIWNFSWCRLCVHFSTFCRVERSGLTNSFNLTHDGIKSLHSKIFSSKLKKVYCLPSLVCVWFTCTWAPISYALLVPLSYSPTKGGIHPTKYTRQVLFFFEKKVHSTSYKQTNSYGVVPEVVVNKSLPNNHCGSVQ